MTNDLLTYQNSTVNSEALRNLPRTETPIVVFDPVTNLSICLACRAPYKEGQICRKCGGTFAGIHILPDHDGRKATGEDIRRFSDKNVLPPTMMLFSYKPNSRLVIHRRDFK